MSAARMGHGRRSFALAIVRARASALASAMASAIAIASSAMMIGCSSPPATALVATPWNPSGQSSESPAAAGAVALHPAIPFTVEESAGGLVYRTPSYIIHTTLPDTRLRALLPTFQELALEHYRTAIVGLPAPTGLMTSYVFGKRDEWVRHAEADLGEAAATFKRLGRGGYTRHGVSVLYDIGYFDTLTIAAHEGWHQYAQSTFGGTLPPWLDEGMATYCEGCVGIRGRGQPEFVPWRNLERFSALRDVVNSNAIRPLEAVIVGSPQGFLLEGRDALLDYYAQVWTLVHFLAEYDHGRFRPALQRMLLDAASGRLRPAAGPHGLRRQFEEYFGTNPSQLDSAYRAFIGVITSPGASNAVYRGESPYTSTR